MIVHYTETPEWVVNACDAITPREKLSIRIALGLLVGTAVGGFTFLVKDPWWPFWSAFGAVVYFLFTSRILQRWNARRWWSQQITEPSEVTWEFTPDAVIQRTQKSETRFDWSFAQKVVENEQGFVIHAPNKQFHWIPADGFESNTEKDRLRILFRERAKAFTSNVRT